MAAALKQMLNLLQFSQMLKSTSLATIDSYKHLKSKLFPRHLALQFLCTAGSLDSKIVQIRRKTLNNTKIAENIILVSRRMVKTECFRCCIKCKTFSLGGNLCGYLCWSPMTSPAGPLPAHIPISAGEHLDGIIS